MNPSDYFRLSIGGLATLSSLTFNQWAAGFCALSVGIIAWLNYFDKRRKARAERVKVTTTRSK